MEMKQVYELANLATNEALGRSDITLETMSPVDVGTEIFNANAVDGYVRSLVNQIGRIIFVNRPYVGRVPSVLMDGWEFGSVLEKIKVDQLPLATENESWTLTDNTVYEQNRFTAPKVSAKFFNKRVTFEIEMSFAERQVKQSFQNAEQLNGFISMIYSAVDRSMTVKLDAMVMRTINMGIAEVLNHGNPVTAVNLLEMYNEQTGATLTAAKAIYTPEFIRFASYQMGMYVDRMGTISSLFNIGGTDKFTPKDRLHFVMLSDFKSAADVYLQSGTFHNEYTRLPDAETVPYWQGSGLTYDFDKVSAINMNDTQGNAVNQTGILAVMFDRDALGVANMDRRVTSHYNAKGEFYNNWFKLDAGYFLDTNENMVVFFVADAE